MLDEKFVPPAYTSFAIVVPPACTSPAMFVTFLASSAWPSSTIAMKCQLVPVLQYLINFSCPSLIHLCSNWCTQAGTSFTILQTSAWPSFTYIGQHRLVPLLQGKVHILCTTFTRVFDWTMWFYTHFHVFKPCSNSLLCSGVLFKQFGLVWQCLNTVRSVRTSRAALRAVRTLSEQCLDMSYICFHVFKQCSNSFVLFGKVWTLRTVFELCAHAHHLQ